MLILAIDTAHKNGSIALAQGSASEVKILGAAAVDGGAFSAQLVPRIAQLLSDHSFSKHQIDAFAVAIGPGSFTGLRIGLAGIKGLVEVLKKPIAAVSSLEALASQASVEAESVIALLDAGRTEFYVGEYQRSKNGLRKIQESLLSLDELQKKLASSNSAVVTSEEKVFEAAVAVDAQAILVPAVESEVIARLGWRKLQAGETVAADALDANYLRRDETLFSR